MANIKDQESIGGLRANSVALITNLSFFLGFSLICSLIVLILERENNFVRFYAKQTLSVSIIILLSALLNVILFVGTFLFLLISFALCILQIIASIKAFNGVEYHIPYADKVTNTLFTN